MHRGVTHILVEIIRHLIFLFPDAYDDAFQSLAKNGASFAICELGRLKFLIELDEAIFLFSKTDSRLPDSSSNFLGDIEFIDLDEFCSSILRFLLMFVGMETWPIG